jgi:hypothetical protein
MFILGMVVGSFLGYALLAIFVVGKGGDNIQYRDYGDAFDDGVSYGLNLNREHGAILAVNGDEIMVQYQDGIIKRFREVKLDEN